MEDINNLLEINEKKSIQNKFPLLNTLAWICRLLGYFCILSGFILLLILLFGSLTFLGGLVGTYLFIFLLFSGLLWLIISEIIIVFLQIEINTRKTQN